MRFNLFNTFFQGVWNLVPSSFTRVVRSTPYTVWGERGGGRKLEGEKKSERRGREGRRRGGGEGRGK